MHQHFALTLSPLSGRVSLIRDTCATPGAHHIATVGYQRDVGDRALLTALIWRVYVWHEGSWHIWRHVCQPLDGGSHDWLELLEYEPCTQYRVRGMK